MSWGELTCNIYCEHYVSDTILPHSPECFGRYDDRPACMSCERYSECRLVTEVGDQH